MTLFFQKNDSVFLHKGDSLSLIKGFPDKSFDMIFADPPYFLFSLMPRKPAAANATSNAPRAAAAELASCSFAAGAAD